MGTNYYLTRDTCPMCGHSDTRLHIGKSSGGWTFSFRGYDGTDGGPVIKSEDDWRRVIAECGTIWDEYGEEIPAEKFWELVESKRKEKLNHTIYCRKKYPDYARSLWLDEKGNSFSDTEFS